MTCLCFFLFGSVLEGAYLGKTLNALDSLSRRASQDVPGYRLRALFDCIDPEPEDQFALQRGFQLTLHSL